MPTEKYNESLTTKFLDRTENFVLTIIAIALVALAVLLLGSSIISLSYAAVNGQIRELAIDILGSILLVMMTMEIVYTVTLSLKTHSLKAEPFLVVGIIAAIRRMLLITAQSTQTFNPEVFRDTLLELALLAVIILVMAGAIFILRQRQEKEEKSKEND
ncbi:MAG TPA: phosphate-starvation-inducible PsiE family protein [Candidatus Bathyarchaeia archaeon]|nr:phosphate-starvation-inducible PsiE family protein [Candidatus Bathyarchaeia archaeon]